MTTEEQNFYAYFCEYQLHLEKIEPYNYFAHVRELAQIDLQEIANNINNCQLKLEQIDTKKDDYEKQMVEHFKSINTKAREKINTVSSEPEKHITPWVILSREKPYEYRCCPERYNVDNFSEIKIKFLFLIKGLYKIDQEINNLENLYKNNVPDFFSSVQKYIIDCNIIDDLRQMITENTCLKMREIILIPALDF
ncbi:hypothetical protein ACSQ6I_07500 [Anabaena sp. WFMT]|uniref:hypothetical protein n=1 Tax=Anabaena sp. WFMT TaxID=3449730 RepID=UPI003F24EEB8